MKNGHIPDEVMFDQLRSILLHDDREAVRRLQNLIDDPSQLSEKISPILEQRLETMRQNFPKEYQILVDKMIHDRLQNSQEQIVEVIYPVLGAMVRKYIEHQFQLLKESIEASIRAMQNRLNFWQRIKMRWAGIAESDLILAGSDVPRIHEIYLVERHSGLLLAHAAVRENLEKESVAGMLTAIKSFVEDAFQRENEDLDYISYDHYKILVENYRSHYLAALVEGSVSAGERAMLAEKLHGFIFREYYSFNNKQDENFSQRLSGLLAETFLQPTQKL